MYELNIDQQLFNTSTKLTTWSPCIVALVVYACCVGSGGNRLANDFRSGHTANVHL